MTEKGYWLFVTDDINWDIMKKNLVWGVSERHKNMLNKINLGDEAVVYIKGRKLGGSFKITSKPYTKSGIFTGLFDHKIDLAKVNIPSKLIDFSDDVINRLKFITNKERWSTHLFGHALIKITKEDFEYLNSLLK